MATPNRLEISVNDLTLTELHKLLNSFMSDHEINPATPVLLSTPNGLTDMTRIVFENPAMDGPRIVIS